MPTACCHKKTGDKTTDIICASSYAALLGGRVWSTCQLAVIASQLQSVPYCLLCNAEAGPFIRFSSASSMCVKLSEQRVLEGSLLQHPDPHVLLGHNAFSDTPPSEQLSQEHQTAGFEQVWAAQQLVCHPVNHGHTLSKLVWISALKGAIFLNSSSDLGVVAAPSIC